MPYVPAMRKTARSDWLQPYMTGSRHAHKHRGCQCLARVRPRTKRCTCTALVQQGPTCASKHEGLTGGSTKGPPSRIASAHESFFADPKPTGHLLAPVAPPGGPVAPQLVTGPTILIFSQGMVCFRRRWRRLCLMAFFSTYASSYVYLRASRATRTRSLTASGCTPPHSTSRLMRSGEGEGQTATARTRASQALLPHAVGSRRTR
jgi:hypothetical protein